MLTHLETFVLYNLILLSIIPILKYGEQYRKKHLVIIAYLILIFISIIRFDIGNDYENMYNGISAISDLSVNDLFKSYYTLSLGSIMVPLITCIVPSSVYTPIIVLAVFSIVFFIFIYYTFDRYRIHAWGVFLLFILLIIFYSWDWVKQCSSVAIFLYSIKYIESKKILKYILCIIFASLFHISALVCLVIYPLINLNKFTSKTLSYILLVSFILAEMNVFTMIYDVVIKNIPYYREIYEMSVYSTQDTYTYKTKTFIITSLWYIFLLYYAQNKQISIIVCIGAVIYMISGGNLLLDRLSLYFTSAQLILVPNVYINVRPSKVKKWIFCLFIFFHCLLYNSLIFEEYGLRGSDRYETIFSAQFKRGEFRYRDYYIN